jgi:hypothetical protein
MLGDTIPGGAVEFDMDALPADVIQDDQVHGFLAAGFDACMDGEARPAHPEAALLGVTLDLMQKVFLGLTDDQVSLERRETESAVSGVA